MFSDPGQRELAPVIAPRGCGPLFSVTWAGAVLVLTAYHHVLMVLLFPNPLEFPVQVWQPTVGVLKASRQVNGTTRKI